VRISIVIVDALLWALKKCGTREAAAVMTILRLILAKLCLAVARISTTDAKRLYSAAFANGD
jgi:uncharacterized membrane protein